MAKFGDNLLHGNRLLIHLASIVGMGVGERKGYTFPFSAGDMEPLEEI